MGVWFQCVLRKVLAMMAGIAYEKALATMTIAIQCDHIDNHLEKVKSQCHRSRV